MSPARRNSESESLAGAAGERVRAIIQAAEETAAEIRAAAEEDAAHVRTAAEADARRIRSQATGEARELLDELRRAVTRLYDELGMDPQRRDETPAATMTQVDAVAEAREVEVPDHPPGVEVPKATEPPEDPDIALAEEAAVDLDEPEGARLVALNMALDGASRDEVEGYLRQHFEVRNPGAMLDEVYASITAR